MYKYCDECKLLPPTYVYWLLRKQKHVPKYVTLKIMNYMNACYKFDEHYQPIIDNDYKIILVCLKIAKIHQIYMIGKFGAKHITTGRKKLAKCLNRMLSLNYPINQAGTNATAAASIRFIVGNYILSATKIRLKYVNYPEPNTMFHYDDKRVLHDGRVLKINGRKNIITIDGVDIKKMHPIIKYSKQRAIELFDLEDVNPRLLMPVQQTSAVVLH